MAFFALALTAGSGAERLPIADFAREPDISYARLSPSGIRLGYLREYNNRSTLHVADLEHNKLYRLNVGEAVVRNHARKEVSNFTWASDQRLVITTTAWDTFYGVFATDWNGGHFQAISGYEDDKVKLRGTFEGSAGTIITYSMNSALREIIHVNHNPDQTLLMLDRHETSAGSYNRPDIVRVNTVTGLATTVVKNPGEVAAYGVDYDGVARFGILSHGDLSGAIYRTGADAPWQTILPLKNRNGQLRPLGLDGVTNRLIVANLTPEKRWAVSALDPANGELSEPLLSDPEYDIVPEHYIPGMVGVTLAGPIFSPAKRTLVGIRYYNEAPRVKWLDKDFARYQAAVDKWLPDTVNLLVDQSQDGKKLLWFCFSDQNPGSYHLLDLANRSFKPLGTRMPWIKPAAMAPMLAIKYTARDGLVIHGYLTVPVGMSPKNLPLVVMPHGGPWVRDTWGFNPLVQMLANRGYAVLQMNYRGSTGYGEVLYQNARRQIGGKIQDDIEDGTRWALAIGLADPRRIAIMGMSYGGYATLFGLGHNPELYRCGISFAGVTDWLAFFDDSDIAEYNSSKRYWREQLGDPRKEAINLRTISPVTFADKITAPVLIIQGKDDQRVPPDQAKRMIEALDRAGRKPESLLIPRLGHTYGDEKQRTEIFEAIAAFLEKHLDAGVP